MTELFWKGAAGTLIAAVLGLALAKQGKDVALLLSVLAGCMVLTAAMTYLAPVMDFFRRLQQAARLDEALLGVLLKAVGISLVAQIAGLICSDAGNAALGKALQILAAAAVLWISLPLLEELLGLIENILGEV